MCNLLPHRIIASVPDLHAMTKVRPGSNADSRVYEMDCVGSAP